MKRSGWLGCVCLLVACKARVGDAPDAAASPQASAVPAPLALATTMPSALPASMPEGGPPPTPLRGDVALAPDPTREPIDERVRGERGVASGYTLSALFRPADVVLPPRAPEVNQAGLDAARKKTELRVAIDVTPSRMRLALMGTGFVLPEDTEIRARADRYGHVVVWPGGATYRPLAPGAMRALLGERRFDLSPIATATVAEKEEVGKRIGIRARKVEVSTRVAKATFEVGRVQDLGEGGVLLCRLLFDLMNAPPQTAACGLDELPLRADLRWNTMGSFAFEITGILKRTELAFANLAVPPTGAQFSPAPPPSRGAAPMLTAAELAAFRTTAIDMPPGPFANADGLIVTNATDQLRVLYIDGVSVLWASAGAKDVLKGLPRGRYVSQWRTFLGEAIEPPESQTVPGLVVVGNPDAGAR